MKKTLALILALSVTFAFSACGKDESESSSAATEAITEEATTEIAEETESVDDMLTPDESFALPEGVTFAQYLLEDFKGIMDSSPDHTAEDIAAELSVNEAIRFMSTYMPVEEGYLSGFTTEITGFESGAMFGPAMGSIAFVGYVFELSDEAAAETFVETLKSNADPRWQICVEAEETICEAVGNKVFFVMAPLSNED